MNLCSSTVTVYRMANGQIFRRVAEDCFYRYEDRLDSADGCSRFRRDFLLIQPGQEALLPGDRIYDGVGPELVEDQWDHFLPETVPGLSVAAYATARYVGENFHHWEAGRNN